MKILIKFCKDLKLIREETDIMGIISCKNIDNIIKMIDYSIFFEIENNPYGVIMSFLL